MEERSHGRRLARLTSERRERGVRALAVGAAAFALLLACGTKHPPLSDGEVRVDADIAPPASFDAGPRKPPGCGQKDDGSFCDCVDVPLFADAPNLYFVLDRSGSMASEGKWDQVRTTVAKIMHDLGPRANFGTMVFPGEVNAECTPPKEVMSTRPGTQDDATRDAFVIATASVPTGGTPTAEALRATFPIVRKLAGKTYVILATDGAPNCNATKQCTPSTCLANIDGVDGCPPNGAPNCCEPPIGTRESCLDSDETIKATGDLKSAGYPVYVIGLPGGERYAAVLDSLAISGGVPQSEGSTKYFKVDSPDVLTKTMRKIAAKIVSTCTIKLKAAPSDPGLVNVYVDEVVVPQDPQNGWKIDGDTVTLLGETCAHVLDGDVLDVRIITGCPTQLPR